MLLTNVTGRKVVSTASAETVGQVAGLVVDPRSHSVVAVTLKKTDRGDTVLWSDISAFGADAVTIADAEVVGEANDAVKELSGKDHRLLGKRVLNDLGEELGKLTDVEFDPETGALSALILPASLVAGPQLMGIGSYAVVVHGD